MYRCMYNNFSNILLYKNAQCTHLFLRYLQIACISVVHEGCTIISGWVRIQRRRG